MLHTLSTALRHNRRRTTPAAAAEQCRIGPPTLVIHGERDPVVSERWAHTVSRLASEGTLLTLPGAPHAVNYTTATALAAAVEPFVDRCQFQ